MKQDKHFTDLYFRTSFILLTHVGITLFCVTRLVQLFFRFAMMLDEYLVYTW